MDESNTMAKKQRKGTGSIPFASILRKTMTERRLTLKEVASLADVSISVVENWLSGSNPHDLNAVGRLAHKLGIPFKKLLLGVSETLDTPGSLAELFDESDLFEGLVKLKVTKLNPKDKKD